MKSSAFSNSGTNVPGDVQPRSPPSLAEPGSSDTAFAIAAKSRADEMRKSRSQPDFPQMLEMVKAFEPAEVHIVSGQADATRAELEIAGKESDGSAMTGKVKLVREDGSWRIDDITREGDPSFRAELEQWTAEAGA